MKMARHAVHPYFLTGITLCFLMNGCTTHTFFPKGQPASGAPVFSSAPVRTIWWELKGCRDPLGHQGEDRCSVLKEDLSVRIEGAGYLSAPSPDEADLKLGLEAAFFRKKYGDEDFLFFIIPTGDCFSCQFNARPIAHYIAALKVTVSYETDLGTAGKVYRVYEGDYNKGTAVLSAQLGSLILRDIGQMQKE